MEIKSKSNGAKKKGFARITAEMLEIWPYLSPSQMRILPVLLSYFPNIFVGQGVVAERSRLSRKTVSNVLNRLVAVGLLLRKRRRRRGGSYGTCLCEIVDLTSTSCRKNIIQRLQTTKFDVYGNSIVTAEPVTAQNTVHRVTVMGVTAHVTSSELQHRVTSRGLQLKHTAVRKKKLRAPEGYGVAAVDSYIRPSAPSSITQLTGQSDSSDSQSSTTQSLQLTQPVQFSQPTEQSYPQDTDTDTETGTQLQINSTDTVSASTDQEDCIVAQSSSINHTADPTADHIADHIEVQAPEPTPTDSIAPGTQAHSDPLQEELDALYDSHKSKLRITGNEPWQKKQITQQKHDAACKLVHKHLGLRDEDQANPWVLRLLHTEGAMQSAEMLSAAKAIIYHRNNTADDVKRWIKKSKKKCTSQRGAGGLLFDMVMQNDPPEPRDRYALTCGELRTTLKDLGIGVGEAGKKYSQNIDRFLDQYVEALHAARFVWEQPFEDLFRGFLEEGYTRPETEEISPVSCEDISLDDPELEQIGGLRFNTIRQHLDEMIPIWENTTEYIEALEKLRKGPSPIPMPLPSTPAAIPAQAEEQVSDDPLHPTSGESPNAVSRVPDSTVSRLPESKPAESVKKADTQQHHGTGPALVKTPAAETPVVAQRAEDPLYLRAMENLELVKRQIKEKGRRDSSMGIGAPEVSGLVAAA